MNPHLLLYDPEIQVSLTEDIKPVIEFLAKKQNLEIVGLTNLKEYLDHHKIRSLINPYGSYFPLQIWTSFLSFIERGGSWLNIGGKPLRNNLGPDPENSNERNAYHREMGIYHYPHVAANRFDFYSSNNRFPDLTEYVRDLPLSDIYEMYYTLVNEEDRTKLDVFTNPTGETEHLIMARGEGDRPLAAAVFLWDHLWGRFNGSRWIFANWKMTAELWQSENFHNLLDKLVVYLKQGANTIKVRPVFASYFPNERPTLKIYARNAANNTDLKLKIEGDLYKGGQQIFSFKEKIISSREADEHYTQLNIDLSPGFYECNSRILFPDGSIQNLRTGFWCYDSKVLSQPVKIGVGSDYISVDDKPYPVIGTSYMASDNHRWTFFDPNPAVWMSDIAEIKNTGINMIRSGLWNGEQWLQPNYGLGGEVTLRAFDAFVQTMAYHKMPLIMTLMAFTPGKGAGHSPWFDPASILWQKELIGQFVRRYKNVQWIIWDLINEPSMSNPDRLWMVRPMGDKYELKAWRTWLRKKHGTIESLQKAWDVTPSEVSGFSQAPLPSNEDFEDRNWTLDGIKQQIAIDYVFFIQDHFRAWLEDHVQTIRDIGSDQLTSMGQTENGVTTAPNPVCHADVVDFTAMHSWSMNDDVLWKILQTKTPGVPHLFGETGSFPHDDPNKEMRRSEQNLSYLYERKYVYSFATRSAGTIHWIWNTASGNSGEKESAVGGRRGSGSEKDEVLSLRLLVFFVQQNMDKFEEPDDDDVCVVTPLDNIFSPRSPATIAMQNSLRTLYFDLKYPAFTASSGNTDKIGKAALLILPSPRTLSEKAWKGILVKVASGATLLITGPVDYDEYWKFTPRLKKLGIDVSPDVQPVARDEFIQIDGESHHVRFTHATQEIADKTISGGDDIIQLSEVKYKKGLIIHAALPLEMADETRALQAFYKYGYHQAKIKNIINKTNNSEVLVRPVTSKNYILYNVISESDQVSHLKWTHIENNINIEMKIPGRRAAMFLLERQSGKLLASYLNGMLQVGSVKIKCSGSTVITGLGNDDINVMGGDNTGEIVLSGLDSVNVDHEYVYKQSDDKLIITIPGDKRCKPVSLNRKIK